MCKSHIETEFNQFLIEFEKLKVAYFDFIKQNIRSKKKNIRMCILANLMEHIQKENSFALYDEDVFEIYKTIIDSYKTFLYRYKNTKAKLNSGMQKNLSGLISVLSSQISFFEEKDNLGINPIAAEKKKIIANCLDKIYEDIERFLEISFDDLFGSLEEVNNEKTKDVFIKYLKEKIIVSYEENMKQCFNNINDNENRQIISYYNDILEEEKEILASIIKVQVKALEDLCKNDKERQIAEKLLTPLKETYQHSKKAFDEHTENVKNINAFLQINIEKDIENIFKILEKVLNVAYEIEGNISEDINEKFKNIILKYLDFKYLQEINNINSVSNEINETQEIFESIKNKFYDIYLFIQNNLDKYNETEFKDIINGVYESINIKIENLNENKEDFFEECINIEKLIDEMSHIDINSFKYNLQETFDYSIKHNFEEFEKYVDKNIFNKNLDKYLNLIEKFSKKIYNFRKDVILFEITTFEEILNYSVVRLRGCSDNSIVDFVSEIDSITTNIQQILLNKNIFQINPEPHTIFDAKEHEILMAEKNEDFKKGEIIKVLNCGYKIFDKVIIRANVIAAK